MINIIVLAGKSASGKNFVARKLEEHGYKTVVTYTTRPKRKGEKQDITYHFISDEEFNKKIDGGFFAEWKSYITNEGVWYYGSTGSGSFSGSSCGSSFCSRLISSALPS